MKIRKLIVGILFILLGIVISVGPHTIFHVCRGTMQMEGMGNHTMSPCQKTAIAETILGIILAILGLLSIIINSDFLKKITGIFNTIVGVLVIAFVTVITGTCKSAEMHCNTSTKPALIAFGSIVIVLGLIETFLSFAKKKESIYEELEQEIESENDFYKE